MKLIILGDVHGYWNAANASVHAALKEHPDAKAVIQLGDLGDGWPMKLGMLARWHIDFDLPIYVVDGNHENFDAIEAGNINPKLRWTGRGSTLQLDNHMIMFFGGATSPDFYQRLIGRTWWPQESITKAQIEYALEYSGPQLTTMFCHERADVFPIPQIWKLPVFKDCGNSDRAALSLLVKKYQPEWYFHGHWHGGHFKRIEVNHWDGVLPQPEYPSNIVNVVACPAIDNDNHTWTVFDGKQIWRNW